MEKIAPHCVHDFQSCELSEKMNKLQQQCVALAKEVGFDEVEEAGIVELHFHKEELSNKKKMQLHEELGLVPKDPVTDICDEDAPIWDLTKTFLCEVLIKFKKV
jgi:hypothetical protein